MIKQEAFEWDMKMGMKLYELADSFGFQFSRVAKPSFKNHNFAEIIIKVDEESMMGFNLNPPLAVKPFKLFPQGIDMGLDEIEDFFEGVSMGRDLYASREKTNPLQ